MKKFLLLAIGVLIVSAWWITEPFRYVPFYSPKAAPVQSALEYQCENYSLGGWVVIKEPMDAAVGDAVAKQQFLGVSTGVSKVGCGRYLASAGYSGKGSMTPAGRHMVTRVASITKPVTAIAVMQLYEQSKLDLDAPIQTYIPSFPKHATETVTVRQLLSQASGVPHYRSKWDGVSLIMALPQRS